MRCYISCQCGACKRAPSSLKGEAKRKAHRALRREGKKALREGREPVQSVWTEFLG